MFINKIVNETKIAIQNGAKTEAKIRTNKKNVRYIDQDEFHKLTNSLIEGIPTYIAGVEVKPSYSPMPKSWCQGVTVTNNSQIPKELKQYIGTKEFKEKVYEYNQRKLQENKDYIARRTAYLKNYDVRNTYFKDIMQVCLKLGIKGYSPCAKTYWEVKSFIDFTDLIPEDDEITDEQIAYVECNARKFGLEIPNNDYYFASREVFGEVIDRSEGYSRRTGIKKSHGYTEEILHVYHTRPNFTESRFGEVIKRDTQAILNSLHPNNIPEEWRVHSMETTRSQYLKVYKQLQYFESLDPETRDFFIAEGYCRCPHCGEITKKVTEGNKVICEYCNGELEEFVLCSNDHLLYGTDIDQAYSNLDDIQDFVDDQMYQDDDEGDYYND